MNLASPTAAAPAAVPTGGRLLSQEEFEDLIRAIGAERYHSLHPFHKLLHGGKCTHGQVQAWVLNRYCYQSHIRSEEHTSELQSLMRISYAVFCLKKKTQKHHN